MSDKQILTALLQLRAPWYIVHIDVDVAKEEAHIFVDHQPGRLPCPTCGEPCLIEGHADDRTWRHLDMLETAAQYQAMVEPATAEQNQASVSCLPL